MRKIVKNAMTKPFEKVTLLPDDFPPLGIMLYPNLFFENIF
jgi:hypothetical protein